jgi:hypothetical protein
MLPVKDPVPALPISVGYEVTLDHLVAVTQLGQRGLNRLGLMVGVVAGAVGLIALLVGVDWLIGLLMIIFGAALMLVIRFALFERLVLGRMARSVVGIRSTAVVGDEGVTFESELGTTHLAWSSLTEVRDGRDIIILVRDRLPIAWIPDAAFQRPEQRRQAVDFMRSMLQPTTHRD